MVKEIEEDPVDEDTRKELIELIRPIPEITEKASGVEILSTRLKERYNTLGKTLLSRHNNDIPKIAMVQKELEMMVNFEKRMDKTEVRKLLSTSLSLFENYKKAHLGLHQTFTITMNTHEKIIKKHKELKEEFDKKKIECDTLTEENKNLIKENEKLRGEEGIVTFQEALDYYNNRIEDGLKKGKNIGRLLGGFRTEIMQGKSKLKILEEDREPLVKELYEPRGLVPKPFPTIKSEKEE